MPRTTLIIPKHRTYAKSRPLQAPAHLRHRQRAERQREPVQSPGSAAAFDIFLIEHREAPSRVLPNALPKSQVSARVARSGKRHPPRVLGPARKIGNEINPKHSVSTEDRSDRAQGLGEITFARQGLEHAVGREDEAEEPLPERQPSDI